MILNEIETTPALAADSLDVAIDTREPMCLWGSPGIGKSQIVAQAAKRHGLELIDIRAVLLDPVDLRGLPRVTSDGLTTWASPAFLPRQGKGIVLLDELNRAPTLVQNGCMQLVLDGRLGEYVLPREWVVWAACNRESDGGGVTKMSSALASRFTHLNISVSLDDWCRWAVSQSLEPVTYSFIRNHPELLSAFDTKTKAFPCPRSWAKVSAIVARNPRKDVALALIAGIVGYGAAIEFMAYWDMYKSLPSLDNILLNPTTANIPTDANGTLYAVSAGLARRATATNLERVCQYIDRFPSHAIEYNVLCMRDATRRDETLKVTDAYVKWSIKHSDVLV